MFYLSMKITIDFNLILYVIPEKKRNLKLLLSPPHHCNFTPYKWQTIPKQLNSLDPILKIKMC